MTDDGIWPTHCCICNLTSQVTAGKVGSLKSKLTYPGSTHILPGYPLIQCEADLQMVPGGWSSVNLGHLCTRDPLRIRDRIGPLTTKE